MGLSSDLAGAFQIILAQQQAEERKESRNQDLALTLLSMEMKKTESALDREVTLIDRQITRNEKRYNTVLQDFESTKEEYEKTTGLIYKLPDKDSTDNINKVLNDLGGSTLDSLRALASGIKNDTSMLKVAKNQMQKDLDKTALISDFYKRKSLAK